jgi:hypothetical protein
MISSESSHGQCRLPSGCIVSVSISTDPSTVLKASAELRALYRLTPKADEPDTVPVVDDGDEPFVMPCDRCGVICEGDSRLCPDCEKFYQAKVPTSMQAVDD